MAYVKKRIFITGGRGKIAGLIKQYLDPNKYEVKLFSRTADSEFENVQRLYDQDYLRQADFLIHSAWSNKPSNSNLLRQPWNKSTDCLDLCHLLRSTEEAGSVKFVFFSSTEVYGNTLGSAPLDESMFMLRPPSWYGQSKIMAEKMIAKLPNHLNLRISNIYGKPTSDDLVVKIIKAALTNSSISIYGTKSTKKDFLYYTDFVNGLDHILSFNVQGIYNICRGKVSSIKDVIDCVEIETGRLVNINYISPEPINWDVTDNRVSNKKMAAHSIWTPYIDIKQGIIKSINETTPSIK